MKDKVLSRSKFFELLAYFMLARKKQQEVRQMEALIFSILRKGNVTDEIGDSIYTDTQEDSEELFKRILQENGYVIDWTGKQLEEINSGEEKTE